MGTTPTTPQLSNPQKYQQQFVETSRDVRNGPTQNRKCQDICCIVTLVIFFLFFLGVGIYFIVNQKPYESIQTWNSSSGSARHAATTMSSSNNYSNYSAPDMAAAVPYIIGMAVFSFVISVCIIILLTKYPKCTVYTMGVLVMLLMLALAAMLFALGNIAGGAIILISLALYCCMLFCFRDKIDIGINLLRISGQFLTQKPTTFLAPFFVGIFVVLIFLFWAYSLVAIQLSRPDSHDMTTDSLAVQDVFTLFWFMLIIFFTYFLFYVMVFLIATACGLWYYNIDKNYLTTGLKNIFSAHLGSLTFASIIITIVTMIKQFLERKNQQNNNNCATCCTFMLCCLLCIIDTIEELIKVLNNNAVIIMSLTGEDYVDSAKTAIYVIMHNYQLFFVVDIICTLLSFCSFLFIAGLPALAGYFLLDSVNVDQNYKSNFVAFGVFIIIFIGFMVASLFMSVISESISSVFIFYCFDQRLQENNIPNNQVPNDMRNLFLQIGKVPAASDNYQPYNDPQRNPNDPYGNPNNDPYVNPNFNNPPYENNSYNPRPGGW